MTNRQVSIRVSLDGGAEVVRTQKEIGDGGEAMGRRVASGMDAASASLTKYERSLRQTAQVKADFPPGDFGAPKASLAAASAYLRQQADMAARAKEFQAQIFGAVAAPSGKKASDSWASFAAADTADRQRIAKIRQYAREQAGANFRSDFEKSVGIGRSATDAGATVSALDEQNRQLESLETRAKALLAEIDPLAVAEGRLAQEAADYNRMLSAGLITEKQHADALAASKLRYDNVAASAERATKGVRLNSFQMTNLVYQMNDVVSGLAMGQRPLSVLLQQGGQIYQVFSGTGMGVVGALRATGGALAGLLSPTALATGAILGLGAGFAYLEYRGVEAGKKMEAALTGTGRAAGVTVSSLNEMAIAAAAQTNESVGKARGWTEQFVKTGKVPGAGSGQLAALVPNYAATTGQDEDAAVKDLTSSFADLGKGVETLDSKTGAFDAATRRTIQTLVAQGQYAEANRIAIEKLSAALVDYRTQMNWFERQGHLVKTVSGNLIDQASHIPTTKEEFDKYTKYRKSADRGYSVFEDHWYGGVALSSDEIERKWHDLNEKLRQENKKTATDTADAWAKIRADLAEPILMKIVPSVQESEFRRELGAQHKALRDALTDPAALKKLGYTREQVQEALKGTEYADSSYLTDAAKFTRQQALQVQSATAITPQQKAQAAADAFRLSKSGDEATRDVVDQQAAEVYNATLARENFQLSQQNRLLDTNARMTESVAAAYLRSSAAGLAADARRQAVMESVQSGIDVEARTRRLLAQTVASQGENTAQSIARMVAETATRKTLIEQVTGGKLAYVDYGHAVQTSTALIDVEAAAQAASAAGWTKRASALQEYIDRYRAAAAEGLETERVAQALQRVSETGQDLQLLRTQLAAASGRGGTMSADDLSRERLLSNRNTLLEQGLATEKDGTLELTEQGRVWLDIQHQIIDVNRQLDLTKAANDDIYRIGTGIFDKLGEELSSSKSDWGNYFDYVLESVRRTAIEMSLINPVKNLFLGGDSNGQQLPTLQNVGGLIGQWLDNDSASVGAVRDITVTGRSGSLVDMIAQGQSPTLSSLGRSAAPSLEAFFREMASSDLKDTIQDVAVTGHTGSLLDMSNQGLSPTMSNTSGGWVSVLSMIPASLFHGGGDVGSVANSNRQLPVNVVRFAPRFHDGADLKPDEIPAILQTGERVLNRSEAADYRSRKAVPVAPTINITNNGEAVSVGQSSYDPESNTLNISLERQAIGMVRSGVRSGRFDTALTDRFGVRPLTTRR